MTTCPPTHRKWGQEVPRNGCWKNQISGDGPMGSAAVHLAKPCMGTFKPGTRAIVCSFSVPSCGPRKAPKQQQCTYSLLSPRHGATPLLWQTGPHDGDDIRAWRALNSLTRNAHSEGVSPLEGALLEGSVSPSGRTPQEMQWLLVVEAKSTRGSIRNNEPHQDPTIPESYLAKSH